MGLLKMMEPRVFKCHKIGGGSAKGEALISADKICFYLADPETGRILEKHHALVGQTVSEKILIFPGGKGSTVAQGDALYMLLKKGTSPRAMIIQHPDTVLVTAAILMKIPLVDRAEESFYEQIRNGDSLQVDAYQGVIRFTGRPEEEGQRKGLL